MSHHLSSRRTPIARRLNWLIALLITPLSGFATTTTAPTMAGLADASYSGIEGQDFTLKHGRWEGAPYIKGGASRPSAGLAGDFRLSGDLDGDGNEEAVVLLWQSNGGSGVFSSIAVMSKRDGNIVELGHAPLGDRVQLRAADISDGVLQLDVVQQGPDDAACCPTQLASRQWTLDSRGLHEAPAKLTGTLSVAALAGPASGQQWQLTRIGKNGTPAAGIDIRLRLDGNKLVSSSGCNRYFTTISDGDQPGKLDLGPIGSTRMACPTTAMDAETHYLQALKNVSRFSFQAGQLLLSSDRGERRDELWFHRISSQ